MSAAERFGRNLFMARRRAGISQESLARFARLHRTEIGLLENGRREPRLVTILKLSHGLGLEPGELLAGMRWDDG